MQEVLKDEEFVTAHLGDDVPERKVSYEDPELGFASSVTFITTPRPAIRMTMARIGRSTARRAAKL